MKRVLLNGIVRTGLRLGLLAALALPFGGRAQSLWQEGHSKSMFADKRASCVGDLLTVIVQESTSANKNNQTATEKKNSMDASVSSFFFSGSGNNWLSQKGAMPALKYSSDNAFSGGGTIANSETILARFAVRVIDVLPNRSMVIEGTRETSFSGEKQNIVLHGIVRCDDVQSDNTVYSYNIADAKIQIIGKGTITDTQRKGWFTKAWDKLTPF